MLVGGCCSCSPCWVYACRCPLHAAVAGVLGRALCFDWEMSCRSDGCALLILWRLGSVWARFCESDLPSMLTLWECHSLTRQAWVGLSPARWYLAVVCCDVGVGPCCGHSDLRWWPRCGCGGYRKVFMRTPLSRSGG
jgi:hypothetical protein